MANTLKFGNGQWATKEGSTLAYNDENGNFKPLPFNFTRSTSATRVNKEGLIEVVSNNEPRIDYKDDSKGALKLEPTRSNLYAYSEDFSNAAWSKSLSTLVITSDVAPDGTTNSVYNLTGTNANLFTGGTTGIQHTVSIYAKSNGQGKDNFKLRLGNSVSLPFTVTDEWVRYEFTGTPTTNVFGLTVDGSPNNEWDILIWGAQLEQGSYATSYIPTQGSVGTRVAESCEQTPPSGIIGQTEGTIFVETSKWVESNNGRFFSISDGTTSNYIVIIQNTTFSNYAVYIVLGGVTQSIYTSTVTIADNSKIAVGYKANDVVIYVNGVQVHTDTSVTIPACNKVYVSSRENGTATFQSANGVRQALLYNTRLSNTELAALTS